jgi:hypothetical protein
VWNQAWGLCITSVAASSAPLQRQLQALSYTLVDAFVVVGSRWKHGIIYDSSIAEFECHTYASLCYSMAFKLRIAGEGHLMSWDEHIMLIAHTVNAYGDKLQVIGNTGSNSTGEALHATEQGFAVGMHAALQVRQQQQQLFEQLATRESCQASFCCKQLQQLQD